MAAACVWDACLAHCPLAAYVAVRLWTARIARALRLKARLHSACDMGATSGLLRLAMEMCR
eukprot:scaffold292164_cov28-Tisochrysis_lutea.AAC.4